MRNRKHTRWVVLAMAGMLLSSNASAAELIGTRGGWEIVKDEDSCWATMSYEGPGATEFTLLKEADGDLFASVTNYEWSAKKGAHYSVSYDLDEMVFMGSDSIGTEDGIRKGFVAKFQPDFERSFAASSSLRITLNDRMIEKLSLAGTAVAVAAVNRCLVSVRTALAAEQREKDRWAYLPKDPFAGGAGQAPKQPATPMGSVGAFATTNDYPSRALREGREGTSAYRLTIGVDGRVSDCQITESSGHSDLDQAACDNVRRRGRFNPATDDSGKPTIGTYDNRVRWVIPKD